MILVDTDVLIEILDKNSKKGDEALRKIEDAGEDISLTSLNLHEILFGLYKYADNKKIENVKFLEVIDFTKNDAILSAKLEVKAEKRGEKIPRFDAMIAAVAINRGFKLFTFNKDHFEGFDELMLF
ncbi:MAG: type II toxin-antitoxin system VapC family toxin [Candidatus Methanoperedens sp.]|nr:type II toxin-antitoxin system VapC family toxin [Candidatus Methanoperedens sp.]MCZ7394504.1 type II toxin-antitoxin system VapC family toxin [Candidatus Methanoperedens sp.]